MTITISLQELEETLEDALSDVRFKYPELSFEEQLDRAHLAVKHGILSHLGRIVKDRREAGK